MSDEGRQIKDFGVCFVIEENLVYHVGGASETYKLVALLSNPRCKESIRNNIMYYFPIDYDYPEWSYDQSDGCNSDAR